jgi:hypothetical protein
MEKRMKRWKFLWRPLTSSEGNVVESSHFSIHDLEIVMQFVMRS